jgi:peroxiredoxin
MQSQRDWIVTLVLIVSATLLGGATAQAGSKSSADKLNKKIDNVAFKTGAGKTFALTDLKDKKAIVAVFLSFDCPVSTSYAQTLATLAGSYEARGVAFVGVVCGDDLDASQIARRAREYKIPFPVLSDPNLTAADAFKAEITPQAFVLDHNLVLRYRGRIDIGYVARLKKNQQITTHDLKAALADVLAGKAVQTPVTEAIGCPIARDRKTTAVHGKVTYFRDVLPILQNKCQTCHRPGEVGPFSLMTYKQAVNWASDIKDYTQSRRMPPWKPSEGVAFHNERKLTDKEIATLAAWVDGNTPQGEPKDAPAPRKFPEGWQLGTPDLVLTPPDDFQLGPSGSDLFRCFVLPTGLTEDKYIAAVEIRPSNPRVVHHTLQFIDTSGTGRKLAKTEIDRKKQDSEVDLGPGYSSRMGIGFLPRGVAGGWAPGQMPRYLPEGTGHFLPKGSDIILQVHYHRDGRLEKDRTAVGLYFAKKPVKKPYKGMVIRGGGNGLVPFFTIPAGRANHRLNGNIWVDQDCTLYSVMAHMHLIGKKIKVTVAPPEGTPSTLLAIDDWDYNWQETYFLKEPLKIKAGTRFDVEAYYDNSKDNPNNPFNPPRSISFGEQTTNEMCFVFLGATNDTPGRIRFRFQPKKNDAKKPSAKASEPRKPALKTYQVPYRLTDTHHILVRVKLNGKGPYNFIIDTGAPSLFLAKPIGKKLGIPVDKDGWATFDRLEIEGGAVEIKAKGRVETPFQLEGMNALGLAGVEIHGMLGYNILACYRMEMDFTKDKMTWTRLDYQPELPKRMKRQDGPEAKAAAGLDTIGMIAKMLGALIGKKPQAEIVKRGFLGIQVEASGGKTAGARIREVLDGSPAAEAGLKAGDVITRIQKTRIKGIADLKRAATALRSGQKARFTIDRDGKIHEVEVEAGEGL